MSENYGNKRGCNNNSGLLYIYQGLSNTQGRKALFPNSKVWSPDYMNGESMKTFHEYMRDGMREPIKPTRRLTLSEEMKTQGGDVRDSDINNI